MHVALILMIMQGAAPVISPQAIPGETALIYEQADRNLYMLGPGDVVAVVVEGGCSEALILSGVLPWASYTVGSDGYLSVSGVGAIPVDGLSIEEAQYALQRTASRYYPSITMILSLHEPRMLRAHVHGMVDYPGTYILSSLSRVSDLVAQAGGISAYGSRSGMLITTGGDTVDVDLTVDAATGKFREDPFLSNNVSVSFDICENPIFVLRGDLIHPVFSEEQMPRRLHSFETWELTGDDSFRSLMDRMGGLPGNIDISLSRIVRQGEYIPIWTDSAGFCTEILHPGDTVMLAGLRDSVIVGGAVNLPGNVPYSPESTVMDYIAAAGGPLDTSGSGLSVYRNGIELEFDVPEEEATLLPGDAVNVEYSWFSTNKDFIAFIGTVLSLGITLYAVNN